MKLFTGAFSLFLFLVVETIVFANAKSWFRLLTGRTKPSVPTKSTLIVKNKWFPLLEYPGKLSWRYPKVKLPTVSEEDNETDDSDGKNDRGEWYPFAMIAQQQQQQLQQRELEERDNVNDMDKKYKHQLSLEDYSVDVPSLITLTTRNKNSATASEDANTVSNNPNIDAQFFVSTLIEKALAKFHFHSQKYLKVLFVPTNDHTKQQRNEAQVLNTILVSLPAWPRRWKHFTLSTTMRPPSLKRSVTSQKEKNLIPVASLEITTVDQRGTFTLQSYKKKGMKMIISISQQVNNGKVILSTQLLYSKLLKGECEVIANSILKELQSLLQNEAKLIAVRQRYLEKFHHEVEIQREEDRKLQLDRIIHPEKYQSKSGTVRRVNNGGSKEGGGRYRPSAAAQARRQVRSR